MFFKSKRTDESDLFRSGNGFHIGRELERTRSEKWTEESFVGSSKGSRLAASLAPHTTSRHIWYVTVGLIIIFALIAGRIFYLQIVQGKTYFMLASRNSTREIKLPAERGIILDRSGKQLVQNIPVFTFAVRRDLLPRERDELEATIQEIASLVGSSPEEIVAELDQFKKYGNGYIPIKINLSHEEALRLGVQTAVIPATQIRIDTRREYIESASTPSLSHVLGYVGRVGPDELDRNPTYAPDDMIGKSGIEASYETLLRGRYGKKIIEVDALGKEKSALSFTAPGNGKNITLTIDSDLQKVAERALRAQLAIRGKKRGSVVIMNPKNGEVLALVSLPAYDNNLFAQGIGKKEYSELLNNINRPLFPRALAGEYPSGSTIKPFVAVAALAEKIISPQTTILSTGGIWYERWFFPDWKVGGHGSINVYRAIAESVNTFFYAVGGGYKNIVGLGPKTMGQYLRMFGFGERSGIDITSEASGLIPDEDWKLRARGEQWYIGDTYHMAIGQGDVLVTPLQLAVGTAAIANGGTVYRPHLVIGNEGIVSSHNELDEELRVVREAMRQTVTGGSADRMADLPWKIAGKTGTAQWKKGALPHAWFTSFAPYDNPELVVVVLIEEGGEGSVAAVPVAREIYNYYFAHAQNSSTNNQ